MKYINKIYLASVFSLGVFHVAFAQQPADEAYFRNQIKILASDEFGGRKPLTGYEDKTINYIADEFKKLGLKPANGDSYFQDVPLINVTTKAKNNQITIKGAKSKVKLTSYKDFIVWSARNSKKVDLKNAQFVFVGFGINAPEYGWDDYKGLDVKGKIVIALLNDPGYYNPSLFRGHNMTYYGRWIYKFEEASRQGAAGVLVIHDTKPASYGWNVVQASWAEHNLELLSDKKNLDQVSFKGWITKDAVTKLLAASGNSYDELFEKAKEKGFKSVSLAANANINLTNDLKVANSHNVAAILPGTDLKDEYVIYTAHWDHFGVGKPINGDSIYNGASDNASGVAALLTIAKKYTEQVQRPRRSILFLSVTAEEAVLLGSQYYVEHPLVPLDKTAADINFDGIAPRGRSYDLIIGSKGDSETDDYVIRAASAQGRTVVTSKEQTSGSYFRSDHFSFAKVGIPVVLASGGFDYVDKEAAKKTSRHYHQPDDEYHDSWDMKGSLDDVYLNYAIGFSIADADKLPQWNANASYKRIK